MKDAKDTTPPSAREEPYRTILEAAHDAIFLMDSERFVLFNQRTLDLFRCTPDDLEDHVPWDFSPERQPDGRTSEEAGLERIRAALAGEPQVFHWVHRRGDGSTFDAEVSLSAVAWDEGVNLLAVVRDVSERKRIEEELRRSEERFRRIVEDQTDFIVRWTPGGRRTFVNRAYCDFYGVSPEDAATTDFMELVHEDDRDRVRRKIEGLTPEEPVATMVHRSLRPDGGVAYTLWTDRAFFDEDGNVREYQSVGRDITEHRRLEEQLRQSQKLEALGRLAGGIAHDFNNSLAIIMGYGELLRDADDDPERQEYVRRILAAAERSASVNYQLLTFARKGGARRQPIHVNPSVRAVMDILEATLPKTITVEAELDPDDPVVDGDAAQLENMLLNLGINAGQAMSRGGTLRFSSRTRLLGETEQEGRRLEPGRYLELCVEDTGPGIPDEVQDHIFEPFFTTKPAGEGTGLGLAAVYGTVQAHGGHITVDSAPGKGTTFTVLLPTTDRPVAVADREAVVHGTGQTILVVEDEEDLRGFLVRSLERLGYEIRAVPDGTEAIRVFEADHPGIDIVLLDMNLPGLDGGRVLERFRETDPDVPVIISTGYAADNLETAGNVIVLQKPYTLASLSRSVRDAVQRA